jgi:hypothetical protein
METYKRYASWAFAALLLLQGCSSDEEKPVNPPAVPEITYADDLDHITLYASEDPSISYQWTTTSPDIDIEEADQPVAYFKLPAGENEKQASVVLTVKNKGGSNEAVKDITVPGLTAVRAYGLGKVLGEEHSNSVDYNWYYDQQNTGTHSLINCGPTSVTMAIKWFDEDFTGTPLDARNTYRSGGGWWYTSDIINYLNLYDVNNYTIALSNINVVKDEIDDGNIVILCLDMYYVTYMEGPSYFHYNKFYKTNAKDWGHFIVIKGYKKVDGKLYFEVYDPYSLGEKYADGSFKGKDRYYLSSDLDFATHIWWDYAIVVTREGSSGGRRKVDVDGIIHKPGR